MKPVDGGIHPRFGTRNIIIPLAHDIYVEVVEVLDHPASDKAPFGQAVRARSEAGGGWIGWVVSVKDLTEAERRLGRESVIGSRRRQDGTEPGGASSASRDSSPTRSCRSTSKWDDKTVHPSVGAKTRVTISGLEIAGDPDRVCEWLGLPADQTSTVIDFTFVAPHGTPGLLTVTFSTPKGPVTI